jgi:uncharacterized membrane protein
MSLSRRTERGRIVSRWVMAAIYLLAGILHLVLTETFVAIVPDWVPAPQTVVLVTGVCELLGAVGLLIPRLRKFAGIMLAAYAVCVFPANIHHAIDHVAVHGSALGWGYHAPRLALQPVIIWWALFASGVIDWPFRADHRRTG